MATDRVHAFALLVILALLHGRERTQVPDTVPRFAHASRLPQRSNWWPQSVLTATHIGTPDLVFRWRFSVLGAVYTEIRKTPRHANQL